MGRIFIESKQTPLKIWDHAQCKTWYLLWVPTLSGDIGEWQNGEADAGNDRDGGS